MSTRQAGQEAQVDHGLRGGLVPLQKPHKQRILSPETALRRMVQMLAEGLPRLAAEGQWLPLMRATKFLLWLTHHTPGSAAMFVTARGTVRVQDAIKAAAGSDDAAAVGMLQPGTALLLQCVRLSESAADLVVESQSVRLLLQLLLRPNVGPVTKRHTGDILQALAATKLVYRDVLHGAGVVEALLAALTDAACLADLTLVQKLLWVLVSLSDDDVVYKDDMREAGLPATLVALFSVYQANHSVPELRPVAAQILRCLQLMSCGDAAMRTTCRQLGLIPLLINQLHLDIHTRDEPPLPHAAANILSLNSLPSTPKSPHKTSSSGGGGVPGGVGGGTSTSLTPSSPMRRLSGSGGSSPRTGALPASGGRRPSTVEPPIPEDSEADVALPDSPGAPGHHHYPGMAGGRGGGSFDAPQCSEAAALRGLGVGPSPMQRLAAAALLRVVLADVMSRATIEVLLHGMLLPALHMQLVGPRLSLAREATATLVSLLEDCPTNQQLAARAGATPLLVQLLSARNIDLASTAAEAVALLAQSDGSSSTGSSGGAAGLGPLTPAAVSGLADLLRECAGHAYALGLGRRRSSTTGTNSHTASWAGGAAAADGPERRSSASGGGELLRPIPEASSANNVNAAAAAAADIEAAAEQVAGTAWAGEKQLLNHPLQALGSVVMRHPSLDRDGRFSTNHHQQQLQHPLPGSHPQQLPGTLTSRTRPRISSGASSGQCLVCSHSSHESCGFCPLSSALTGLCVLLTPSASPELQEVLLEGGCLEVVVGLIAGEVGHQEHSGLLASLAALLAVAVAGNSQAQDQVRLAGGLDVLSAALSRLAAAANKSHAPQQCILPLLHALAALVSGNSANKLALREAGALTAMATLLDVVLAAAAAAAADQQASGAFDSDQLAAALLEVLVACLPDSPGSQLQLHQLGVTGKLLTLLRLPSNSPGLYLGVIAVLGLLANTALPAALSEVTAGGLVAVVMNVLQQQAMAGVLVSEVCMNALPSLLAGNPPGKAQALQYGVLPLLVHLLRSSPSPVTVVAAAKTLAVLAERDTELQGQITAAGGLHALLDKLDPANNAAPEAQAAAAAAAATAAASAAAEAVARAAAEEAHRSSGGGTGSECEAAAEQQAGAEAQSNSRVQQTQQQQPPLPGAAARIFSAVEGVTVAGETAATTAAGTQQQQQQAVLGAADAAQAAVQHQLRLMHVRVACLEAVAALAHDNMFTKNTARQQGVMLLLVDLLHIGKAALQASVTQQQQHQKGTPQQQQQQQYTPGHHHSGSAGASYTSGLEPTWGGAGLSPGGSWQGGQLRVRTHRGQPSHSQEQQQQQAVQAVQLQMLVAAVAVLAELCHGNHSNQQAAAAEGLIDQLTSLAALALGDSLEAAAQQRQLLAGIADALSAASEFCIPNKLVARESGAVDVLSRALLMAAEVPDMSAVLGSLRLFPAIASCCGAVVALAQDCEEDQRAFTDNPDFLPALLRLLSVGDPAAATQAARALEFIAIRNDFADDADDRSEFEADTVLALIRALSHGALAISGSGRTAAARVALGGSSGPAGPSAALIKEAAQLLALVVDASEPAAAGPQGPLPPPPAGPSTPAGKSGSGAAGGGIAVSGLGTAPAHPAVAATAAGSHKRQGSSSGKPAGQGSAAGGTGVAQTGGDAAAAGVMSSIDPLAHPAALMPAVVTDHTSGLAVLRTWSVQEDLGGLWQALVARTAPAFQAISSAVAEGPWKPFKLQVAWMLLLLAAKSAANRAIISRVQRTTLTPLAMQLENAERFYQQAAQAEAAAEAASSSGAAKGAGTVRRSGSIPSSSSGGQQQHQVYRSASTGSTVAAAHSSAAAEALQQQPSAGASIAGQPSLGGASVEDDEMSMLQAEVAFLGLMSGSRPPSASEQ